MLIYKITNKINGKIYVGQTSLSIEKRFDKHIKCAESKVNRHLYDSMNHYGYDNFIIEMIEDNILKENIDERERFWISELHSRSPKGYNMTEGGGGGYTLGSWDEDSRKELYKSQALSRTGSKRTEQQKQRMSESSKLRYQNKTKEEKEIIAAKISQTLKEKKISPPEYTKWKKGQKGTFSGKNHREDSKKKMSNYRIGKTYEDIMGYDKAIEEKNKRAENFRGEKNPRYIEFPPQNKIDILNILLQNPNTPLKDLILLSGISSKGSKISCFLKSVGIKNLQLFRRFDVTTQKKILEEAINYVNRNL